MTGVPQPLGPLPDHDLTVDQRLDAAARAIATGEAWLTARRGDLAQAAAALADSHLSLIAIAADHGPSQPGPTVGFGGNR